MAMAYTLDGCGDASETSSNDQNVNPGWLGLVTWDRLRGPIHEGGHDCVSASGVDEVESLAERPRRRGRADIGAAILTTRVWSTLPCGRSAIATADEVGNEVGQHRGTRPRALTRRSTFSSLARGGRGEGEVYKEITWQSHTRNTSSEVPDMAIWRYGCRASSRTTTTRRY